MQVDGTVVAHTHVGVLYVCEPNTSTNFDMLSSILSHIINGGLCIHSIVSWYYLENCL